MHNALLRSAIFGGIVTVKLLLDYSTPEKH